MNKFIWIFLSTVSFGAFSVLYGHPGGPHQHKLVDIFHYLSDPFHLTIFLLMIVCSVSLFLWLRGRTGIQKITGSFRSNS